MGGKLDSYNFTKEELAKLENRKFTYNERRKK
jgi:hypothetical protein